MSLNAEDTKLASGLDSQQARQNLCTQDARQGHTGDGARYVLVISTGLSVVAGVVLALVFFA